MRAGPRLPEIKILDFGLARITEIGMIKDALAYISAEQAGGSPSRSTSVRTSMRWV